MSTEGGQAGPDGHSWGEGVMAKCRHKTSSMPLGKEDSPSEVDDVSNGMSSGWGGGEQRA